MTTVITVPLSLDDETFEEIFEQLAAVSPEQKVLIDARRTRWASPYGLTALLAVAQSRAERAAFAGPDHEETAAHLEKQGDKARLEHYQTLGTPTTGWRTTTSVSASMPRWSRPASTIRASCATCRG